MPTKQISTFSDFHLQPLVKVIPNFDHDSDDFFSTLQNVGNIPERTLLVNNAVVMYSSVATPGVLVWGTKVGATQFLRGGTSPPGKYSKF